MGLFDKIQGPKFLKEDSSLPGQIDKLDELLERELSEELSEKLKHQIKILKSGHRGEQAVENRLKNSHMPMLVLRDVNLAYEDLSAQIDFLVFTRKRNFVIECKNLSGEIEITERGDFLWHTHFDGIEKVKRIDSPITQVQQQLGLVCDLVKNRYAVRIMDKLRLRGLTNNWSTIVVFSNSSTIIDDKLAKSQVKNQIVHSDNLVAYIKAANSEPGTHSISEREMYATAQWFLSLNKRPRDYSERYYEMAETEEREALDFEITDVEIQDIFGPGALWESQFIEGHTESPIDYQAKSLLCPICQSEMVRRTASSGEYAGQPFYGCSQYSVTGCKGKRSVEEKETGL